MVIGHTAIASTGRTTMSIEFLGEKIFREEIETSGQVWVAKNEHQVVYAMELDRTGFSLPIWSTKEKVETFLKKSYLVGPKYTPHAMPIEKLSVTWLSDLSKGINEVQLNPEARASRVLVMTKEEFQTAWGGIEA
jgi:hypothetical protein